MYEICCTFLYANVLNLSNKINKQKKFLIFINKNFNFFWNAFHQGFNCIFIRFFSGTTFSQSRFFYFEPILQWHLDVFSPKLNSVQLGGVLDRLEDLLLLAQMSHYQFCTTQQPFYYNGKWQDRARKMWKLHFF